MTGTAAVEAVGLGLPLLVVLAAAAPTLQLGVLLLLSVLQAFVVPSPAGRTSGLIAASVVLLLLHVRHARGGGATLRAFLTPALVLVGLQVVSLLWAPSRTDGVRWILSELPFFAVLVVARQAAAQPDRRAGERGAPVAGPFSRGFRRVVIAFLVAAGIQPVLVVLFRLQPGLEDRFLHSSAAGLVANPTVVAQLFTVAPNNVLDPAKSGGLFVNANVASLYCGVLAVLSFACWRLWRTRTLRATTALQVLGVVFTGSKAGLALLVIVPLSILVLEGRLRRALPAVAVAAVVALVSSGAVAGTARLFGQGQTSLGTRQTIWRFAWHRFLAAPLTGDGFGGWEDRFQPFATAVGLSPRYPPHNVLLYTLSQSGLLAAVAMLAFTVRGLRRARAVVRGRATAESAYLAAATWGAALWVFLHGLGDNTSFVGDVHVAVVLALVVAMLDRVSGQATDLQERSAGAPGRSRPRAALQGV